MLKSTLSAHPEIKKRSPSKRTSTRRRTATQKIKAESEELQIQAVSKPKNKARRGGKVKEVTAGSSANKKRTNSNKIKHESCELSSREKQANGPSVAGGEPAGTAADNGSACAGGSGIAGDKQIQHEDSEASNSQVTESSAENDKGGCKEKQSQSETNQGFVQVNSKNLTEGSLQTLTRLDTIQAMLPTVSNPLENEVTFYMEPQTVSNVFSQTTIPSSSVLQQWKEQLQQHTNNRPQDGFFYIEVRDCRYSIDAVHQMLLLHKAKDIRCAVEKELEWFAGRLIMPKSVLKHPSSESLKKFQDLVFRHKWDEELDGYGMSGEELAKVCGDRWMSNDIIQWVLDLLNTSQQGTLCIFSHPRNLRTIDEKYVREQLGYKKDLPSSLFFLFSVGWSKDGVFFDSEKCPGCHFSFCHLTRLEGSIKVIYGDSLGWPAPNDLRGVISTYFTAIYNCQVPIFDITMCHVPNQSSSIYEHSCSNQKLTCAQNFPLQKCGSICGMVTLMMAAFACLKRSFFDLLTTVHSANNQLPSVDLQHLKDPSSNAKYLRRVLATWFSDKEICVDYLIPIRVEVEESGLESEQETLREAEAEMSMMNGTFGNGSAEANVSCQNHSNQTVDDNTGNSNNVQCIEISLLNSSEQNKDGVLADPSKPLENSILVAQDNNEQTSSSESSPTANASSGNQGNCCPKCSYTTKLMFNMKRHMKRHHPDITFTPPLAHSCPSCSFSSNKSYDIYKHVSRCHPGVQWTAQMQRRGPKAKEGPKRHKCPQCPYQSNSKHNINRHQQSCHDTMQTLESSRIGKCQCLECGQRLYKISDLRRHLSTKHAFIFKTETVTLESYKEFEEWKASIEIAEGCSFTKTTGDKVIQGKKRTQYFQCNRSGTFRSNNKGKRRQKWQGSCKIESNCTSTMVASILESGQVEVECVCTHYSHQIELQHVWIPKGRKRENTTKGNQGYQSREQIIKDISDVYGRLHVLNRQEIPDIVDTFVVSAIQRQTSDQLSVLSWIKQWETSSDSSPILCYNLEGSTDWVNVGLKRDEFMVVVQTELQKEMAQKFGKNGICCDQATVAGPSDFAITTLQVVDEFGQVQPIAWCLSSSTAQTFIKIFFEMIKESCGDLSPAWFMSQLYEHFHDVWTSVFSSEPRRLICPWYVDAEWTETLKKTVGNVPIESRVYKLLRILLEQSEQKLFEDHLQTLLDRLSVSAKTQEFRRYFLTEWVSRKHQWTYCYNGDNAATTAAFVEPFYQTFHSEHSQANVSDRLDTCLLHLLKYARDCLVKRRISLTKGRPSCQEADIQARHAASTKMDASFVKLCPEDPHRWEVIAEDQVVHTVQESAAVCKQRKCPISCLHCNICIHQYICNCLDSLIHTTICKHIHLVHSTLHKEQGGTPVRDTQWLKDRIQSRVHRLMAVVNSATSEHFSALQELDSKLGVCSSLLDCRLLWGPTSLVQSRHDVPSQGGGSGFSRKDKRKTGSADGGGKKKHKKQDGEINCIKDGVLNQSVEETPLLHITPSDADIQNHVVPISTNKSIAAIRPVTLPPPPIHVTSPQQINQLQHSHVATQQIPPAMTSQMVLQTSQQTGIITYPPSRTIMSPAVDQTTPSPHQFASLSHQPIIHTPGGHFPHTHQLGGMPFQQLRPQMPSQLGPGTSQPPMDYHQTVRPVVMGHADTQQLTTMSDEQLTTLAGVAALFGEG